MILFYLILLFIAPQLWIEPFVGLSADYVLYPLWLLAVMMQGRMGEFFRFTSQDKFFLMMLFWIVLSTMLNDRNDNSGKIIFDYVKFFLLYKLVVASTPTFSSLKRVGLYIVVFGLILTVEGIQHKLSPDGIGWAGQKLGWVDPSVIAAGGTGRTQWINIFDGPGVFCVVFTTALPFLLWMTGGGFSKWRRLVAFALVVPVGIAIYYTGSRGGFLATLAILGIFLALKLNISMTRIAIVGGILSLLFMLAPSHLTSMEDESRSAQHRVDMWVEGVEMVTHNPLLGIGKGNFGVYTGSLIAHNSAIEIMGEMGLPGLFLWFGLIYMGLRYLYCYYMESSEPQDRNFVQAIAISIMGYLASAMFVTLEYETFYFLLAMCASVGRKLENPPVFTGRDMRWVASATIGWVLVVKVFVMMYYG